MHNLNDCIMKKLSFEVLSSLEGGRPVREILCDKYTAVGIAFAGIFLSQAFAIFTAGLALGCAVSDNIFWDAQI